MRLLVAGLLAAATVPVAAQMIRYEFRAPPDEMGLQFGGSMLVDTEGTWTQQSLADGTVIWRLESLYQYAGAAGGGANTDGGLGQLVVIDRPDGDVRPDQWALRSIYLIPGYRQWTSRYSFEVTLETPSTGSFQSPVAPADYLRATYKWNGSGPYELASFASRLEARPVNAMPPTHDFSFPVGVIPEPATWAMMVAGVLLLGASVRHRSDRNAVVQAPRC